MNPSTTMTKELCTCPACRNPIVATFTMSVAVDFGAGVSVKDVGAIVTITGARVSHDCIPKQAR